MDIDLNPPNAERPIPPATPLLQNRHRQRTASPIARMTRPTRSIDRTSIAFGFVQEARQIYPAEDDCSIGAVARGKRS
jgi:hypothetical protein